MKARERILKAADRIFGEMGFDAATVRRIAEISKTNKALIHYHFDSKEGLFENVLDHYFEELSEKLQKTLIADQPLPDRMNRLFERYIEFLEKNKNFIHIIHRELNGGKQMQRVIAHMVPLFQLVLRGIREAYPATRTGELSAEHLLVSGYGIIITYFTSSGIVDQLIGSDSMSPKNLQIRKKHLYQMFEIIVGGLKK